MTKKERSEIATAWAKVNVLSGLVDSYFCGQRFHPSGKKSEERKVILKKLGEVYTILESFLIKEHRKNAKKSAKTQG